MTSRHLTTILTLLVLASLALPALSFITSPLDWTFAPNHTLGLVCPSLRYGCCPDLATWISGSPCEAPRGTEDPQDCYKRKQWACCQDDNVTYTCTTGFRKGKNEVYGWRSGTNKEFLGVGNGAITTEEIQELSQVD